MKSDQLESVDGGDFDSGEKLSLFQIRIANCLWLWVNTRTSGGMVLENMNEPFIWKLEKLRWKQLIVRCLSLWWGLSIWFWWAAESRQEDTYWPGWTHVDIGFEYKSEKSRRTLCWKILCTIIVVFLKQGARERVKAGGSFETPADSANNG